MASKRLNVMVYSGTGSSTNAVRHCLYTFRRLLSPNYAVSTVSEDAILKEPWATTCALLVMPGGADLGYSRVLNGAGNQRITAYIQQGGAYLGCCAGGYYGSQKCEFEVGNKHLEVIGDRELAFFPGICRGLAFPGFVYQSEAGARAAELKINKESLKVAGDTIPETFRSYYNGGGVFVDAEAFRDRAIEVLASYTEDLRVDSGYGKAAIVYCQVGNGHTILTGPHPEFTSDLLNPNDGGPGYSHTVNAINADTKPRIDFLKACISKLRLQPNHEAQAVPSLSCLHLCSYNAVDVSELVSSWSDIITKINDEEFVEGENDVFHLAKPSLPSDKAVNQFVQAKSQSSSDLSGMSSTIPGISDKASDWPAEFEKIVKRIVVNEDELPSRRDTPYFNLSAFFSNLNGFRDEDDTWGKHLLYGEVVTSTNSLLEKNPKLLCHLPAGFTCTATTQVAGRGRGSNVWISPSGALMFSIVIRHDLSLSQSAPVVFVQYLAGLAVVESIHTYGEGYSEIPVKLKWPNDIYALDPAAVSSPEDANDPKKFVKIGGILVNSSFSGSDYTLVCGVGLNVTNAAPTISLNSLLSKNLASFTLEKLLARTLTCFEHLYKRFRITGFDRSLEDQYYSDWLHSDQVVTLETEEGARVRIKGITRDFGLLRAEELGSDDRPTGRTFALQSDSNSFDFFRGLLKRKI